MYQQCISCLQITISGFFWIINQIWNFFYFKKNLFHVVLFDSKPVFKFKICFMYLCIIYDKIRQTSNHRLMFLVVSPVFLPLFLTNILSLKTRRLISDRWIPLKIEFKKYAYCAVLLKKYNTFYFKDKLQTVLFFLYTHKSCSTNIVTRHNCG